MLVLESVPRCSGGLPALCSLQLPPPLPEERLYLSKGGRDQFPNSGRGSGAHVPTDSYKPLSGIPWHKKLGSLKEAFGLSKPSHREWSAHSDIHSCSSVRLVYILHRRPQWKVLLDTALLICLSPSQANKSGQLSWYVRKPCIRKHKATIGWFLFGFVLVK